MDESFFATAYWFDALSIHADRILFYFYFNSIFMCQNCEIPNLIFLVHSKYLITSSEKR